MPSGLRSHWTAPLCHVAAMPRHAGCSCQCILLAAAILGSVYQGLDGPILDHACFVVLNVVSRVYCWPDLISICIGGWWLCHVSSACPCPLLTLPSFSCIFSASFSFFPFHISTISGVY